MENNLFEVKLKSPVCIEGISEDSLRQLVDSLLIESTNEGFSGFVMSSQGVQVFFDFGPDGNFNGIKAKVNGKNVTILPGVNSRALSVFEGPPSASNPGPGWEVVVDLTQTVLGQTGDESQWTVFFAKRVAVFNNFSN